VNLYSITRSLDRKTQQIYTASLEGFTFNIDSKRVLTLLKELCLYTEAEAWFRNIKCGRAAMKALQLHYDGPDESKQRKEKARSKLKSIYYKHEGTLSHLRNLSLIYMMPFRSSRNMGSPSMRRRS